MCLESLEMYRQIYGADTAHPSIAASLLNLARVHEARGGLNKAERLCSRSHEMYKQPAQPCACMRVFERSVII